MSHRIATQSSVTLRERILERIARSLVHEIQQKNTTVATFRCQPSIAGVSIAHTQQQLRLKADLSTRTKQLLKNQKRQRYKFAGIDLETVGNTIHLLPFRKDEKRPETAPLTRLQITLTVTRL